VTVCVLLVERSDVKCTAVINLIMTENCTFSHLALNVCIMSWLGLVTCKNRRPYNLYCVGGDVKPCSINLLLVS